MLEVSESDHSSSTICEIHRQFASHCAGKDGKLGIGTHELGFIRPYDLICTTFKIKWN